MSTIPTTQQATRLVVEVGVCKLGDEEYTVDIDFGYGVGYDVISSLDSIIETYGEVFEDCMTAEAEAARITEFFRSIGVPVVTKGADSAE